MKSFRVTGSAIARRLIIATVLFSSAITLVITSAQLYLDYDNELDEIHTSLQQIETSFLSTIALGVWSLDGVNIRTQLDGLLKIQDIEYLKVSASGRTWKSGSETSVNFISQTFPLRYVDSDIDEVIGDLTVVAGLDGLHLRLLKKAVGILISNGIKTFLVAGFIVLIFQNLITKHLIKLGEFTTRFTPEDNFTPLALERSAPKAGSGDELDMLVRTINGMCLRMHDHIQEREKSLSSLQESEKRLGDFAGSSADWFWEMDADLNYIYASERFFSITGYRPEEMYGRTRNDIINLDLEDIQTEKWQNHFTTLENHEPFRNLEYTTSTAAGETLEVTISGVPVFDLNGTFLGYRGTGTDQSEIQSVRETAEKLTQAIENLPVGIALFDWMDQLVFANNRYGLLSEVSPEFLHPGISFEEIILSTEITLPDGSPNPGIDERIRMRLAHHNNPEEPMEFSQGPIWVMTNEINLHDGGTFSIITDVTDRKRLEDQFRHAQRMEAVGQLTGGVAHDFNNLLAVMIGNTELIEMEVESNPALDETFARLKKTIDSAASLTHRLLAFSRRQALSSENTDIGELIRGTEYMLRRTLGEIVDIEFNITPDLWHALIDPSQLDQAILNLAINARDAMAGSGKLTIEAKNTSLDETYTEQQEDVAPGDYVEIAVSDSGTGMSPEILDKVFEPFFTTKEVGAGSGLGLSMVYGFVHQSKGHITAYSEIDQGTTIKLYLPRSFERGPAVKEQGVAKVGSSGNERVLVVEDDLEVRDILVRVLAGQGYKIFEAGTGEDALRILEEEQPIDLLFTDIVLPGGMSGKEIADKAARQYEGIKILFSTGYAENHISRDDNVEQSGMVNKPYRRAELLEKVRKTLDGEQV
jgi:PAS domain S-box-containing protein